MIILKCPRCGHLMGEPVDDWVNCPKCGLPAFVGVKEPVAEPEEAEVEAPEAKPKRKTEAKPKARRRKEQTESSN